jgi:hypothetical protein
MPGELSMKPAISAALALVLSIAAAHAQQGPGDSAATARATTPIAGIDDTALAGSARASKLIGSKVYQGVLGVGDRHVAVPVNQIKVGKEARFTTELTKDQLANAPAFDFAKLQ